MGRGDLSRGVQRRDFRRMRWRLVLARWQAGCPHGVWVS